ncbi:beta-mannosidase [Rhizobium sp. Leaf384]|uniref:glycosyl hydrolase 2 galactose-binding domain-containing protein n=1 Tax=unclassified Rhizobium TaxID=2613769 RepID=UPI000712598C|nr:MULTISPECIES: glycoside hydrolase family 2 protein [unclassified Rhizobium]KQS76619.1 beta-mannosidase [Rhizobium sp. Leaf383]KQS77887.1 beta-mannosidase [Rhizobium sp. Leaf384]
MTSLPACLRLVDPRPVTQGWRLVLTAPGLHTEPSGLTDDDGIPALVPGTVAEALEAAGLFDRTAPHPLNGQDAWFLTVLEDERPGEALLRFEGLATIADVFLNGEKILSSQSMFTRHAVSVRLTGDKDRLAICCRALLPHLSRKLKRARWRTKMIVPAGLRGVRTTTLGYMPGWCPEIQAAGPYRPVTLERPQETAVGAVNIAAALDADGTGHLTVRFETTTTLPIRLCCAGHVTDMSVEDGHAEATLVLPGIAPWWPRSHGEPRLHDVEILVNGDRIALGRTGFRRTEIDRGADGTHFALKVNGVDVFCRGAVWTNADIARLPGDRTAYAPWLHLAAEANMNMIRIGGTMTYETQAFFALCDELGLMVWQDVMLANFDYPAEDEVFAEALREEVETLLQMTRASPSLVIVCGGSEMYQQAAMMGLAERVWAGPLTETLLPGIVADLRPDLVYVPNSPFGGAQPFSPNAGVGHYYGVGAYERPLEDARRADVRFAAECLAFSNVPEQATLDTHLPVAPVHDPRWKARVPRDRDASWDFEDTRDHYLGLLYGLDPARLRREDPARYLDLSRAVTGEVVEATFSEWRRTGSGCGGALVWTLQDLLAGAGWGLVDATGLPKPVWHAARRAFRPVQVLLLDEGTNGLDVHLVNDTADAVPVRLELTCLRAGRQPVVSGRHETVLAPRSKRRLAATDLFGAFYDTTYAFRFAGPQHDVTEARLVSSETNMVIADAFHFPLGRRAAIHDATLTAAVVDIAGGFAVDIATDRFAQSIHIVCPGFLPSDNWFHLAPGPARRIGLMPLPAADADATSTRPACEITAIGSAFPVHV